MQGQSFEGQEHRPLVAVQIRFSEALLDALEGWRRRQRIIPSRPAAIRALLLKSLADDDSTREWSKS
jgi:hypothetical protein